MSNIKKVLSIFIITFLFIFLVSCGKVVNEESTASHSSNNITNPSQEEKYFNVTFKDEDGTVLKSELYKEGTIPSYNGFPTKESNAEYTYEFDGWDKEISTVKGDITYTATFKSIKNKYIVTWKNYDGNVLELDFVAYGVLPTYDKAEPTKESNAEYTYRFAGWDKEISTVKGDITYTATFESIKNKYTVTWKNYDGNVLEVDSVEYGVLPTYDKAEPTKESNAEYTHRFDGWDKEISTVKEDITYTATFESIKNKYTVTWKNYDGNVLEVDSVEYGVLPTFDGETPLKPEDDNNIYVFKGWDKEISNVTGNVTYIATYDTINKVEYSVNYYFQNVNNNEYTLDTKLSYTSKGISNSNITIKPEEFEGFKPPLERVVNLNKDNIIIDLLYDINTYKLTLKNNIENAGTTTGSGDYRYNQYVELSATPNDNYKFNGWAIDGEIVSTNKKYSFNMQASDLDITAVFEQYKFKLTFDSLIPGIRVSYNAVYYEAGKNVSAYQYNGHSDEFEIDWVRSDNVIYTGKKYEFLMPSYDLHIQIKTDKTYFRISNVIYFGAYPSTQVSSNNLIETLNEKYGLPNNNSNWVSYNYYEWNEPTNIMYYIDVDYDNNGVMDFRGVYFTKYRPYGFQYSGTELFTNQDENGYYPNTVYWFNYDLISWYISSEANGYATIYATYAIDSQPYNNTYPTNASNNVPYEHNGGTGFANSYELSDIRKWLHETFYLTAFNSLQKSIIQVSSVETKTNTMEDYIYLFSLAEAGQNDIYSDSSDYAKCQGNVTSANGIWTSTPDDYGVKAAVYKTPFSVYEYVGFNYYGIIPVCKIKL